MHIPLTYVENVWQSLIDSIKFDSQFLSLLKLYNFIIYIV